MLVTENLIKSKRMQNFVWYNKRGYFYFHFLVKYKYKDHFLSFKHLLTVKQLQNLDLANTMYFHNLFLTDNGLRKKNIFMQLIIN